jgi:effector-binding domain-containing protein
MKKLRNAAIILIGVILLIVLIGYLLPRKVHVERVIMIKSPARLIFDNVNILEKWKLWSPWNKLDTSMKISYDGKSGKGAGFSWHSLNKKVGNGSIIISECKPNEFLSLEMDFGEKGKSSSYFRFETKTDSVRVSWGFDNDLGINPFIRYFGGMIRRMVDGLYESGLASLKEISEKQAKEKSGLKIYLGQAPTAKYLSISGRSRMVDLSNKLAEIIPTLMDYLPKHKSEMTGPPVVIYNSYSSDIIEFIAALPFSGDLRNDGKFKVISLPSGSMVIADYYGSYQKIGPAYKLIQTWIKTNKKVISGSPWEEYVSDPAMEKDTSLWLTKIYFPVK